MPTNQLFKTKITALTPFVLEHFETLALELFYFQAEKNPIYARFLELVGCNYKSVKSIEQVVFMPISFFKTHQISTCPKETPPALCFKSSGTTAEKTAEHLLFDPQWYQQIATEIFENQYGPLANCEILALLPSYLERKDSSLVYMVEHFFSQSGASSGFYLNDYQELAEKIEALKNSKKTKILLGVTFALIDFAQKHPIDLSEWIIMETGGMKNRGQEILRFQLHQLLQNAFSVHKVHAEYGMTELLSQAYSTGSGVFRPSKTLRMYGRSLRDPFDFKRSGKNLGANIVDLANVDTCAFIAADDLVSIYPDGSFELIGRIDNSDLRGCTQMFAG